MLFLICLNLVIQGYVLNWLGNIKLVITVSISLQIHAGSCVKCVWAGCPWEYLLPVPFDQGLFELCQLMPGVASTQLFSVSKVCKSMLFSLIFPNILLKKLCLKSARWLWWWIKVLYSQKLAPCLLPAPPLLCWGRTLWAGQSFLHPYWQGRAVEIFSR